ncbi:ABC-type transport auxiliary lipoprotein family protein [Thiorhodococcus minor]|uniref:ABC-type transport auxiliary lipoprotein component domain-containing protein n=1 Tax=Thiorhodococcus minor TaxID=57489 RepID=A0A6M0K6K2_9GAMM|nr:ABC-type transport auxiliary lipoprotein family protein [Thiorhodococcus minor]NEV65079.1 hypothetical protein [Thiorhodococcus minor]
MNSPPATAHRNIQTASQHTSAPASSLSIAVDPVSLPAAVDRPESVVTAGSNQVRLEEFERWDSPPPKAARWRD